MAHLTGQTIDRYHILEKLGEGGMATVYKAYDTRLETDVAVKVIRMGGTSDVAERTLKRFEQEAKALARLTHPNIVKVTDYGKHEDKPYLVMPFLPGQTLKHRFKGEKVPYQEAAGTLIPIAKALAYAHKQSVIHRDVKPANILVTASGELMISDFGVAKMLNQEVTTDLTGTSATVGTPEYMAPEQATAKAVDHRADIYALGVVLYEMVTGRKPYSADTPMAVMIMHARDPLPRPSTLVSGLPKEVEALLLKALSKNPSDRYQSMEEMIFALGNLIVENGRKTEGNWKGPGKASIPNFNKTSEKELASGGSKRFWIIGLVLILVISLGILASWLVKRGKAIPPETQSVTKMVPVTAAATETSVVTMTPTTIVIPELGIGSSQIRSTDGMEMMYVPAAEFIMGFEDTEHSLYLNAYWIDKTEVTNAMFQIFVEETGHITDAEIIGKAQGWNGSDISMVNGANWMHPLEPETDITDLENHPVVQVSWNDAFAYCQWAGGRLPTEAEWEMAARGTDGRNYPWGNREPMNNLLNFADASLGEYSSWVPADEFDDAWAFTAPVGSYPDGISPYGVNDMVGNVWEWVNDWHDPNYHKSPITENPTGPETGAFKVVRGGSWYNSRSSEQFIASSRIKDVTDSAFAHLGFRCAEGAENK
ncbi:MAG: SUMF1/EgtB/PvdO family nonheme iron enzyme [Anaerolineae bacterium]|jgi:eukaryotic-like serine/threonine-protein kinase|nr:SUMF1/EgtB/PvdO family nonheme iron enzyme [Anaerolineae bacterium]